MAKTFHSSVRVPYAHTDQMGFVYYAHYLVYFEMARAEMLREAGIPYSEMEDRGIMLPVVEAHCEYQTPAKFDDFLEVHSSPQPFEGAKLKIHYTITRGDDTIVTGYTHHVSMTKDGKVKRPAPELKALIN